MLESPVVGSLSFELGIDAQRVRVLDFTKAIKVELTNKGSKFVVFEELRDDFFFEGSGVFDNEGFAIFRPDLNILLNIGEDGIISK